MALSGVHCACQALRRNPRGNPRLQSLQSDGLEIKRTGIKRSENQTFDQKWAAQDWQQAGQTRAGGGLQTSKSSIFLGFNQFSWMPIQLHHSGNDSTLHLERSSSYFTVALVFPHYSLHYSPHYSSLYSPLYSLTIHLLFT